MKNRRLVKDAAELSALALGSRSVLFVGGKGGVGKTTIAAALALRLAEEGERVLLVSTDPAHSLGDLFDRRIGDREVPLFQGDERDERDERGEPGVGEEPAERNERGERGERGEPGERDEPTERNERDERDHGGTGNRGALVGLEIDPDAEVDRYLEEVRANMRSFVRPAMFAEIERQIELTRHSPGAAEAALLDRVADLMHHGPERFDRVIFDTAPTGHTLRLLTLPEIMSAWTDGMLRRRDRSDEAGRGLRSLKARKAKRDGPAPGDEAEEGEGPTGDDLAWFDQPTDEEDDPRSRRIREILLDRRRRFTRARRRLLDPETTAFILVLIPEKLPILESRSALEVLQKHRVPVAGLVVNRVLPEEAEGRFMEERRLREATYLERIEAEFADLLRVRVPLLASDVEGLGGLRLLGRFLVPGS